jgi:hypothetical protein
MKDCNLLAPDLHDFSDLPITLPKGIAAGALVVVLVLLYGALGFFGSLPA